MTPPHPSQGLLDQRFAKALSLHRQGRLGEAEPIYRSVLSADSEHFLSLLHLGVLRLQQGSRAEALELTRAALRRDPNSAEAHSNLGAALQLLGRPDEAILAYESALAVDPDRAEAHYGLAVALHALSRHHEAIACYERTLAIDPDYAEANCGLGAALHAVGRNERAVACYEAALAIDPDYVEAQCGRGAALQTLKRHDEAIAAFGDAVTAEPDNTAARNALGLALQEVDRHDEALAHFRHALAVDPRSGDTQVNLGSVLKEIGRIDEARHAFQAAVEIEPENVRFRYALVNSRRACAGDPHLAAMEAWARDIDAFPEDQQILLYFALGKALAETGRHEKSFRFLVAGNALKRQQVRYDERATLDTFNRIKRVFTTDLMVRMARMGHPSAMPVFIIGMPRSGSTLVEQMLASHPKVFGGGERQDFSDALASIAADPFPQFVPGLTADQLERLGAVYLERVSASATAERITDKMLANFCLAGLIHLALPNARLIHTRRDPVDTCLSCFTLLFGAEQPFAYDLGELGRYYRAYARLMKHWREVLPEGVMLDVQYEELVGDFEPQARRIVAHCGLEWDDACLAFHQTQRVVRTASVTQVRQPIYRSSVGRWRPADAVLRPLLDTLTSFD